MLNKALLGSVALALTAIAGAALAEYPERPVTFVVPWPPGDLEDVLTRLIAEEFQNRTGAPAAVVNMPGGGGVVAGSRSRMRRPMAIPSVPSWSASRPSRQWAPTPRSPPMRWSRWASS